MTERVDSRRTRTLRVRDAVLHQLTVDDQRQVTDLIDAGEFGVALEWIVDSLAEGNWIVPRSVLELVIELAKEMDMYPAVLERLPPTLIEPIRSDTP